MAVSTGVGWHVLCRGGGADRQAGPLTWDQLYALSSAGSLAPTDLVWHPSLSQWLPAQQVLPASSPPAAWTSAAGYAPALQPAPRQGAIRSALAMILNPGQVLKGALQGVPWPFCLMVSGVAFAVFFLQTALDLHRAGTLEVAADLWFALIGLGMGIIGVALVAMIAWVLSRPLGCGRPLEWTVRAFCLAYSPTLIFVIIGLAFNLALGRNTSVAFGITGALWAFHPMLSIVKELTKGKFVASLVLTAICGGLIISAWALLGTWGARL